jgi:hypothetical protein
MILTTNMKVSIFKYIKKGLTIQLLELISTFLQQKTLKSLFEMTLFPLINSLMHYIMITIE